jgi:hypothetical protein
VHRQLSGIPFPFYSSFESDFNYDMQMSDERGEGQGISVFFRLGDAVFHTYTALQRGVEGLKVRRPSSIGRRMDANKTSKIHPPAGRSTSPTGRSGYKKSSERS